MQHTPATRCRPHIGDATRRAACDVQHARTYGATAGRRRRRPQRPRRRRRCSRSRRHSRRSRHQRPPPGHRRALHLAKRGARVCLGADHSGQSTLGISRCHPIDFPRRNGFGGKTRQRTHCHALRPRSERWRTVVACARRRLASRKSTSSSTHSSTPKTRTFRSSTTSTSSTTRYRRRTHARTPAVPCANDAVGMMNAARQCRILHAHPVMRAVPSRSAAAGGLAPPRAT